jgi:hypothetical protein
LYRRIPLEFYDEQRICVQCHLLLRLHKNLSLSIELS